MSLTQHAIHQANHVAALEAKGFTTRQIAEEMHVSSARISQIRSRFPEAKAHPMASPTLRLVTNPAAHLYDYRDQLRQLRRGTVLLALALRRALAAVEEEILSAEIDELLEVGHRTQPD